MSTSSKEYQQRHQAELRRLLIESAIFTVPLLLGLAQMSGVAPFLPGWLANPWLQWALATPVQFHAGALFYRGAWKVGKHGATDMNTLIAVGTSAAYFASAAFLLLPDLGMTAMINGRMAVYFDTSATIVTLILFGRLLEARAKGRASDAIRALAGLQPKRAQVIRDGRERDLPIDDVRVGDFVLVSGDHLVEFGLLAGQHRHGRPGVREGLSDGPPDAPGPPGDERDATVEPERVRAHGQR